MGGDQGHGLGFDQPGHRLEGPQPVQRLPRAGQPGRPGELVGPVGDPIPQHLAQHRVRGDRLQQLVGATVPAEGAQRLVEQAPQPWVGGGGHQVTAAGALVAQPAVECHVDGGVHLGHRQRDALRRAQVEQIQVGARVPAAGEQIDRPPLGTQPRSHPLGQRERGGGPSGDGGAVLAVGRPPAEPLRRVHLARVLAGQQPVGARLREDPEPELVVLDGPAQTARHDLQQPDPRLRALLGEHGQRGAVGVPEGGRSAHRGRGGDQVGDQGALLRHPGQSGRLDQAPGVLRQRGVRRHARRAALHGQLPVLRPRLAGVEPPGQILHMLLERLDRQRPGEGELQEHRALPVLVHGQRVHPLGLARLAEEGRRVRRVLVLEEDPRGLLVERRQEVRDGPAEPLAQCLEAVLGGAWPGLGLPGEPLDVLDQGQRVVAVGRVVDQRPGGEAECLAAHLPDLGRPRLAGQAQELQGEILRLAQCARHQPDDAPVVQGGVGIGADGEGVGVLAVGAARRKDGARLQQRGRGGLVVRAHAAFSSSSMSRPAYSAAAMRMPSDQATGPT